MATKLYFHDAANALSGTFPSGELSSLTPDISSNKAGILRTMSTTKGTSQVAASFSSLISLGMQTEFVGLFCSDTLNVSQSVGAAADQVEFCAAHRQSDISLSLGGDNSYRLNLYVWRPSSGAIVGQVLTNVPVAGTLEPPAASQRSLLGSITGTTSTVLALAGDVLICEIFQVYTPLLSLLFTGAFFYDGATETLADGTVTTDCAAFINFKSTTLTFGAPLATISASFSAASASAMLAATGQLKVSAASAPSLEAVARNAAGVLVTPTVFAAERPGINQGGSGGRKTFRIPDWDAPRGKGLDDIFGPPEEAAPDEPLAVPETPATIRTSIAAILSRWFLSQ